MSRNFGRHTDPRVRFCWFSRVAAWSQAPRVAVVASSRVRAPPHMRAFALRSDAGSAPPPPPRPAHGASPLPRSPPGLAFEGRRRGPRRALLGHPRLRRGRAGHVGFASRRDAGQTAQDPRLRARRPARGRLREPPRRAALPQHVRDRRGRRPGRGGRGQVPRVRAGFDRARSLDPSGAGFEPQEPVRSHGPASVRRELVQASPGPAGGVRQPVVRRLPPVAEALARREHPGRPHHVPPEQQARAEHEHRPHHRQRRRPGRRPPAPVPHRHVRVAVPRPGPRRREQGALGRVHQVQRGKVRARQSARAQPKRRRQRRRRRRAVLPGGPHRSNLRRRRRNFEGAALRGDPPRGAPRRVPRPARGRAGGGGERAGDGAERDRAVRFRRVGGEARHGGLLGTPRRADPLDDLARAATRSRAARSARWRARSRGARPRRRSATGCAPGTALVAALAAGRRGSAIAGEEGHEHPRGSVRRRGAATADQSLRPKPRPSRTRRSGGRFSARRRSPRPREKDPPGTARGADPGPVGKAS